LAPNNASAWNYLRGILDITSTPYASTLDFVLPYADITTPRSDEPPITFSTEEVVDLENPLPSKGAHLPAVAAIEFLADIYESVGGETKQRAIDVRPMVLNHILYHGLISPLS
jgi:protein farnesyltransferase/geranylgeranyltransferase type-1 subunit alpha